MLTAGGLLSASPSSSLQVESAVVVDARAEAATKATTTPLDNTVKQELPTATTSPIDGLRFIASFFKNFLDYQVVTWRQLAGEAGYANRLQQSALIANCLRLRPANCNTVLIEQSKNNENFCSDCNKRQVKELNDPAPGSNSNMMHNRQVRGVDGFVSRCTVRSPGPSLGSATRGLLLREMADWQQRYIYDKTITQTPFDNTDQLVAATASFQLRDSAVRADRCRYDCPCRRPQHKAARLSERSNTIDATNLDGQHPQAAVRRQVSDQERHNQLFWLSQALPLRPSNDGAVSSSLPSSQTIDQQTSLSASLDYSVDEPISLPANMPSSAVGPAQRAHQPLARSNTQLVAPYGRQVSAANLRTHFLPPGHLSEAFAIKRPNSSMEQRTLHQQQQRQHLRQRQISVEADYCASPSLVGASRVRIQQNLAKIDTSSARPPATIGSDSELYHHPNQSILQTNGRPYYIHQHSSIDRPSRDGGNLSIASQTSSAKTTSTSANLESTSLSATNNKSTSHMLSCTANTNATIATSQKKSAISKKSLSLAGAKRRLGFKQRGLSGLSVQRSEEVLPLETSCSHLIRHTITAQSLSDSGTESSSFWFSLSQQQRQLLSSDPRCCFVEGLGAGQIASRQALVSPYLGDIQLALNDRRGMLEVDVIRARSLQVKAGAKSLPSPYVKVYLMRDKKCIAKCKTSLARRTLDPLYQQKFIFREEYVNCVLQVIVWGDYGKKDRKSLMGIVQIHLDDLDISDLVIGWYKLFNVPSMTNSSTSSKALRHLIMAKNLSQQQQQFQSSNQQETEGNL